MVQTLNAQQEHQLIHLSQPLEQQSVGIAMDQTEDQTVHFVQQVV
jgi:hypothetical protein